MEDLCRVIVNSVSTDVRRNEWPNISDEYYDVLYDHLKSYNRELSASKEDLWQLYEVRDLCRMTLRE